MINQKEPNSGNAAVERCSLGFRSEHRCIAVGHPTIMERNDEGRDTHSAQRQGTCHISASLHLVIRSITNECTKARRTSRMPAARGFCGSFFLLSDRVRDGLNSLGGRRNTLIWGDTWPRQSSSQRDFPRASNVFPLAHGRAHTFRNYTRCELCVMHLL